MRRRAGTWLSKAHAGPGSSHPSAWPRAIATCMIWLWPGDANRWGSGEGRVMDLDQQERLLPSSSASQPAVPTTSGPTIAVWPAPSARPVMPVISVEAQLRRRGLRRLGGRLFLFLLDALMLNVAFIAAYYLRYEVLRDVTFTTAVVDIPF